MFIGQRSRPVSAPIRAGLLSRCCGTPSAAADAEVKHRLGPVSAADVADLAFRLSGLQEQTLECLLFPTGQAVLLDLADHVDGDVVGRQPP